MTVFSLLSLPCTPPGFPKFLRAAPNARQCLGVKGVAGSMENPARGVPGGFARPAGEGREGKKPGPLFFWPGGRSGGWGGGGRGYGGGDALDFGRNWRRIYRSDTLRQSVRPPHFTAFFRLFGQGILLMKRKRKPVFDPKAFLAKAAGGRTISKYQKDQ